MTQQAPRANLLGDIRAEADTVMLERAYYDTPDFRTMVETNDRTIVVGRRGTGKSALVYRLKKHWGTAAKTRVIALSPEEDQVLSLRPVFASFGDSFRAIRSAARLAWKYAFALEIAASFRAHYQFRSNAGDGLVDQVAAWTKAGDTCSQRLRATLRRVTRTTGTPEERIGDLAKDLGLKEVLAGLDALLGSSSSSAVLLVDRLDEGFEPDGTGVALVAGIVHAGIDLNTSFDRIRPMLFLRDNIYRSISKDDPDASRDLEGQVLRLHWSEYDLFNLVSNRLRVAFEADFENNQKVWNRCTAQQLHGIDGFRQCLRLTLYRPRDILSLLNDSYYSASRQSRRELVPDDIESTARTISQSRLDDLKKEYSSTIPGLAYFVAAFAVGGAEMALADARARAESVLVREDLPVAAAQDAAIHGTADDVLRTLYSVGFLGVKDAASGSFRFCHDGQAGMSRFDGDARLLVHPCYWLALSLAESGLTPQDAQEIHDEYQIAVVSTTPQVRDTRIGSLIASLGRIATGEPGAHGFEEWCHEALRIVCSGHLRNLALHPNRNALQRRDVVGTNLSETPFWRRLREDYAVRQVVFEVKNYAELTADDYRQVLSYLSGEYGRLAFVVTRDEALEPRSGRDLEWVRELASKHGTLVIKLTGKWLAKLLSKLRSPQKHDTVTDHFSNLLDSYVRLYLDGQGAATKRKKRRR